MSITINGTTGIIADSPATVKANAFLDAAGGNTATVNGTLVPTSGVTLVSTAATQTLTNKTLTSPTITGGSLSGTSGAITQGTAVASTSGTAIDFTGIPSWAKKVTVMLNGVSTNGTSLPLIQLGTSSGVTASGYTSFADNSYGAGASQTTGFGIERVGTAATSRIGIAVIANISGNGWVFSYNGVQTGSSIASGAGSVSLAAVLDRIRITTVGGADTFDAGTVNIMYEG